MRVLMLTQKVDRHDDILGFTHDWITALAGRVAALAVVALAVGEHDLPPNVTVHSMGKERGRGQIGLLAGFDRGVLRYMAEADAVFVHMIPRYALLAAPVAAAHRKPMTLWFTHRSASLELRLAIPLVRHIATAHPSSFPLPGPKVHALGHGIDTRKFAPGEAPPGEPPIVASLGRLSPIKRHETLIRAAALLRDRHGDRPGRCVSAGGCRADGPSGSEVGLRAEIDRLRVGDRVTLWGAVPAEGVTAVFHQASVAVNFSPPGLFDKAVLEAMLCAVPTVVANPAFDELLGEYSEALRIEAGDDAAGLAARLQALLALSPQERRTVGLQLRQRAAASHSLDGLMDRLVALLAS